jgi:hypothetical protein
MKAAFGLRADFFAPFLVDFAALVAFADFRVAFAAVFFALFFALFLAICSPLDQHTTAHAA